MEVLVDASALLCFCSLRGLTEQMDPVQREMLYTVGDCLASEYCVEEKEDYCLVLSSGLPVALNHVANDPSLL